MTTPSPFPALASGQSTELVDSASNLVTEGPKLTGAHTDTEAISTWLIRVADNPNTLASYRREAERLMLWAGKERGKTLGELMVEDLAAYRLFLRDPQPREDWCMEAEEQFLPNGEPNPKWKRIGRVSRYLTDGSPNPVWRPFVKALSPAAAKQAETVLFGLFEHLVNIRYLHANPLRGSQKRQSRSKLSDTERYFDSETWEAIKQWIEAMPKEEPRDLAHYHRARFIFRFLFLTGLRRFEFAKATTSDLRFSRGKWWIRVLGKGDLEREVPITSELLDEIKRYRQSVGLSEMPMLGEEEPLVMDVFGARRPLSEQAIYAVIKEVCRQVADSLHGTRPELAQKIHKGSTHWLRHSAASHQIEMGVPLLATQANLGHASLTTTQLYLHKEKDLRHEQTEIHRA